MALELPTPGTKGEVQWDGCWYKAIICEPKGKKKSRIKVSIPFGYMMLEADWITNWRSTPRPSESEFEQHSENRSGES